MTKRITKYVAEDGTEFLRKGDAEVYPRLRESLLLFVEDEQARSNAAINLLMNFSIKTRNKG